MGQGAGGGLRASLNGLQGWLQDVGQVAMFRLHQLMAILLLPVFLLSCGKEGPYGYKKGMRIVVFKLVDDHSSVAKWEKHSARITDVGEDYIVFVLDESKTRTIVTKKELEDGFNRMIKVIDN